MLFFFTVFEVRSYFYYQYFIMFLKLNKCWTLKMDSNVHDTLIPIHHEYGNYSNCAVLMA